MKKKQLHEALAVLLTKLSSARDNPLLMDNYAVKALRTVLLNFKESGELHEAASNQGKRADEERRRNEPPLDGRRNPVSDKQRDNLQGRNHRGYSLFGKYGLCGLLPEGNQDRERLRTVCYCRSQ